METYYTELTLSVSKTTVTKFINTNCCIIHVQQITINDIICFLNKKQRFCTPRKSKIQPLDGACIFTFHFVMQCHYNAYHPEQFVHTSIDI